MVSRLFPDIVPQNVYQKPEVFDSPQLRLLRQDPDGTIHSVLWKVRLAKCEAICSQVLVAILPVGAILGGSLFFAKVTIAPLAAQSFGVIAVACMVVFVASKIILYALQPSLSKYIQGAASRLLKENNLEEAFSHIHALTKCEIAWNSDFACFKGFLMAISGADLGANERSGIINALYLQLATKYADQNNYQMALSLMPRGGSCDQAQMEDLLTRIKEIPNAPAILEKLTNQNWHKIWELKASMPTTTQDYQDIYEQYHKFYNEICIKKDGKPVPKDPNQGYSQGVRELNNQEPSLVIKALRVHKWIEFLKQRLNQGHMTLTQEQAQVLGL